MKRSLLGSGWVLLCPGLLFSQVLINTRGAVYTENFNSLASVGSGHACANNVTLTGWYADKTTYNAGTGSSNAGALYSFGVAGISTSSDRALGSLVSGGTGSVTYGVRFKNNTCNDLISFLISYTGEQWRQANNSSAQKIDFQYQLNAASLTSGTWTDLDVLDFTGPKISGQPNALDGNDAVNRSSLSTTLSSVILKPGEEIWFRWVDSDDAGTDHGLAIDDFSLQANGEACYYQSNGSGSWSDPTLWLQSDDNLIWAAATFPPTRFNGTIRVMALDTLEIDSSITVDQVIIDAGAVLTYADAAGSILTVNDGTGADLVVNGEFHDLGPNNINWSGSSTWQLGAAGTILRTRSTNANLWRDAYEGGIGQIPASANWIIRKTGTDIPSLTGTSMTYPNLIIENFTGTHWNMGVGSVFTGFSDFPKVLGRLDIGGTGSGTLTFKSNNTNVSPILIEGDLIIRSGCTLENNGTGFEIQGALQADGDLTYTGHPILTFSGSSGQSISGTGQLNIATLRLNKTAGSVQLSRNVKIDSQMVFVQGYILSTSIHPVEFGPAALPTGMSAASFISGPVRYTGLQAFTFPVGKGNRYRPVSISASGAGVSDFTCEYFRADPSSAYAGSLDPALHHISACEYWMLDRNAVSISKEVTLTWDSSSCGVTQPADLRVARWNGAQWVNEGQQYYSGNAGSGSLTSNLVSSFSPFTLASTSTANPLPVELISFVGEVIDQGIRLQWKVAHEINFYGYEIQSSPDGMLFESIGFIDSDGNQSGMSAYYFDDARAHTGQIFYRLKIIDLDGRFTFSQVVTFYSVNDGGLIIENCSIAGHWLDISLILPEKDQIELALMDLNGRRMAAESISADGKIHHRTYLAELPAGLYLIRIQTSNEKLFRKLVAE